MKMILFSYSSGDIKDEERRKGWVVKRRLNVVLSAKPVVLFQDDATTLGRINVECPLSNTGKEFLGLGAHRTA